jgi:hypothetical protein
VHIGTHNVKTATMHDLMRQNFKILSDPGRNPKMGCCWISGGGGAPS